MRRVSFISALLIAVFAASAFTCALDLTGGPSKQCGIGRDERACARAAHSACGHQIKAVPDRCSFRSFSQSQFTPLPRFVVADPLLRAGTSPALFYKSTAITSSVGPPETDRGPPRS